MIALVAIVKDEAEALPRSLPAVRDLIDSWVVLDTGSTDDTVEIVHDLLEGIPGELHRTGWTDYAQARNELLGLARDAQTPSEWLLTLDADEKVEFHPGLRDWLAPDPDPSVDAWEVEIREGTTKWHRPCLIRTSYPWEYREPAHEYLVTSEAIMRPLLGLTINHFGHAEPRPGKFEEYLELLQPGADQDNPRSVFYIAEALRYMGREEEATGWYERRSLMGGFEEEAWYAAYMAARLRRNIPALLAAHARRPWRPEPLRWAARFVTEEGHGRDVLFIEEE